MAYFCISFTRARLCPASLTGDTGLTSRLWDLFLSGDWNTWGSVLNWTLSDTLGLIFSLSLSWEEKRRLDSPGSVHLFVC